MKRLSALLPLIVAALMLLSSAAVGAPDPATSQRVDALVQQVMQETRIPGMAVGIVEGDQVIYLKGFGTAAKGRLVTPQTPFIIGSMSKSFTAMAVMQLVEAGKLDLEAPVQRYLPWFRLADEAASAQITLRHLLTHTSGLPRSYDPSLMVLDDRTSSEQIIRALAGVKLSGAPGERFEYCNLNYITLGLIVQTVSGIPFDQYISQRILTPLQMRHSFTDRPPALADGMATGHIFLGGLAPMARQERYSRGRLGEGFIISSTEDMTRYLLAVMHGGTYAGATVLTPERMKAVTEPLVATHLTTYPDRTDHSYGMGWEVMKIGGETLWEHGGETATFRSAMAILPGRGRGLVILSNANSDATMGVERLEGYLIDLLRDQPKTPEAVHAGAISYVVFLAPFVLLLWAVYDLLRLPRWRRRLQVCGRRVGDWLLAVLSLLLGLFCFVGVPAVLGTTLSIGWAVDPLDQGAIVAAGGLGLIAMFYRCLAMWGARRHPAAARASASA